jgi:serine/threonine protein kinase
MNNVMLAAMVGGWEILLVLGVLGLAAIATLVGGLVLLAVRLARKGQIPKTDQPHSPTPPQPFPTTPPAAASCPRCGAPLPANSPQGLCPRCVLGIGLATQTEAADGVGPHGTKVIRPPPAPDEIGKHFPQLEILECLGRGGMGVVYKARQPKLNRIVALKILAPEKEAEPKFAQRFLREAQTLARLNHPNIVTVHDFGETDGLCYLLMEFVDGLTLRQMMREGRMKSEEALAIVPRICEALQFAHEQGIVHRDIKPENVLLDKQGRVKIADFGIAKLVGGTPLPVGEGPGVPKAGERVGLTQDHVLGTPHYMAPEQVEHPQTVDHRADIYSLGVVFYEMLTGELPLGKFQPPSKKVQIDVRLDEVVLRALEKQPECRYQQVSEVKTCVETIVATRSPGGPPAEPDIAPGATANKSEFVRLFETLSGSAFTSPLAIKLINVSALGFLGALAFLSFVPLPGMKRCIGFSGFTGFFGLIGVAFMVEMARRRKAKTVSGSPSPGATGDGWWRRHLMPDDTAARWAQFICFGLALVVLVMGIRKLATLELRSHELLFGVTLIVILALVMTMLGLLAGSGQSPWSQGPSEAHGAPSEPKRYGGWAVGLFLVGTLGSLLLMIPFPQPEQPAVLFGGAAFVVALVLGLMSWRERLGRLAVVATGLVFVTLAVVAAFSVLVIAPAERAAMQARMELEQQNLLEQANQRLGRSSFGPVIECVLVDVNESGTNKAIRFRTGEQTSPPAGSQTLITEWMLANRMDMLVSRRSNEWSLITAGLRLRDFSPVRWDDANRTSVRNALSQFLTHPGELETVDRTFLMHEDTKLPWTLAFRTSERAEGLLQITGFTENPRGVKIRYKLVQAKPAASVGSGKPEGSQRKFVRLVVDKAAMTFEGQPTTWDGVGALLEKVPERKNTVLECAVTSDQITVQQQNEWFGKCIALAHSLGFEYASFIGIHPLGSKGTTQSN